MQTPDEYILTMAKTVHPADEPAIRERVRVLIEQRYNDRQGELAAAVGLQPAALSLLLNGKKPVSMKQLRTIEAGSRARLDWLLTGDEPMFHPIGWVPFSSEPMKEGEFLRQFVDERADFTQTKLAETLSVSKSTIGDYFKTTRFDDATRERLLSALRQLTGEELTEGAVFGDGERLSEPSSTYTRSIRHVGNLASEPVIVLPFVPIRARAGVATPQYWEHQPETTRIMRASLIDYEPDTLQPKRNWWIIEVDGDSMEPQLISRARVLGYYVGKEQVSSLKPGVWAIQYDDEFVIKRVRANNIEREGGLLLHSDNPPPDPYFVRVDQINHVWFIEKTIDSPVR